MMTTLSEFLSRLERFLADATEAPVRALGGRQLTGGASRDSWAVDVEISSGPDAGRHALVLRRDMGGTIQDEALTREQEFRMLSAAWEAGVLAPRPRWLCNDPAVLGVPFFLMDRLEGESVGRRIVRDPGLAEGRRLLPRQMGEQLARIHRIDPKQARLDFLPAPKPDQSPAQAGLTRAAAQLQKLGEAHPALELGLRWLWANAPACENPVLVHGDFRIGNLMVGPDGLHGVFDWEFAHIGDPAEDLAWPCVRSWRFGQDARRLGGIGDVDEFFDAYAKAGGKQVNRRSIDFWEIAGNFRWAVGSIAQAHRHLSGQVQSVELASLGRRTAEMELELLELIDRATTKDLVHE